MTAAQFIPMAMQDDYQMEMASHHEEGGFSNSPQFIYPFINEQLKVGDVYIVADYHQKLTRVGADDTIVLRGYPIMIKANGAHIDKNAFPHLHKMIGENYGGDGIYFRIPDLEPKHSTR